MFPLAKRKIGGYTFGQPTFYNSFHTGTDYEANYLEYHAPFDGYATAGKGPQAGIFWTLTRPNGHKFIARHLSKIIKTGYVKEGELVAITGNTGSHTTKPHLHKEVYIDGKLSDPEKYDWNPMTTIRATVVINGGLWASLPTKLQEINNWYRIHSGGKLEIVFTAKESHFDSIPFKVLPDGSAVIDEPWFDANVLDPSAHTTILVIRDEDLPDNFPGGFKLVARTLGYMGKVPTKTVVACAENDPSEIYPNLNAFIDYVEHELMHSCYLFSGSTQPPPLGSGLDQTHKYFYDLKNREASFSELNYSNINNLLKGVNMAQIKTQAKGPERRIVLAAANQTEWISLCKVFGKDPNTVEETV